MHYRLTTICLALLLAPAAYAAPCEADEYTQFDFLVGEWVVRSLDGQPQGENSIAREERGCLLVERWRGSQGGTGQSYNYYHVGDEQWHQLWISQGAIIDYAGGLTASGAMRLEGQIVYQASGLTARFTGQWTPRPDGSVLQELRQWDPDTRTWSDWFIGVYTRKP